MRKKLACLLALSICLGLSFVTGLTSTMQTEVMAEETETNEDDFEYSYRTIEKYKGNGGAVVIPEGVMFVQLDVFRNNKSITSITIPKSFYGDLDLQGCSSLKEITYPETFPVTNLWLKGCTGLQDENGFVILGDVLFDYFGTADEVTIPAHIKTIERDAFYNNQKLKKVTLPAQMDKINIGAFAKCKNLKEVVMPKNLKQLGDRLIDEEDAEYGVFKDCEKLEKIVVPEGVIVINEDTFAFCDKLNKVTLPKTLRTIEKGAFEYCENLKSVKLPETLRTIEKDAFYACKNLKSIKFPEKLELIGAHSFENCTSLTAVTIPKNVERIGYKAFYGCSKLKTFKLLSKKATIGRNVLTKTKCVSKKNDFTIIGSILIKYNGSEKNVTIPNGVKMIADDAFSTKDIVSVKMPNSVTSIGNNAFNGCWYLKSVTLSKNLEVIGDGAFSWCRTLSIIALPDKVKRIGVDAFRDCCKLKSITIPSKVKTIEEGCFEGCDSLTKVKLPKGLKTINIDAFDGCEKLKSIQVPSTTTLENFAFSGCKGLKDKEGFVIVRGQLFDYFGKKQTITVPKNVIKISCYIHGSNVQNVVLSEGTKEIQACRFADGVRASVTIPSTVTQIDKNAFYNETVEKFIIHSEKLDADDFGWVEQIDIEHNPIIYVPANKLEEYKSYVKRYRTYKPINVQSL